MPRDNSSRRGNSSRNSSTGRSSGRDDSWSGSVMEMARERPIAAAAAAAGAAAAGLFLWSKRSQISRQISDLSEQIGEWTDNMTSGSGNWSEMDDTAGLTTSSRSGSRNSTGNRSTGSRSRGMSETGGGNASLGSHSGGIGTSSTGSPSGRGRARSAPMPS